MTGKNSAIDWIAGACGGAASLIVGHPLDTTKVQLQTQEGPKGKIRLFDIFRKIRRDGIFTGFFRGLSMPLYNNAIQFSIYFGVYGQVLKEIVKWRNTSKLAYTDHMVAGYVGGISSLVIRCPLDVIKSTLQTQAGNKHRAKRDGSRVYYKGSVCCLKDVYQTKGVRGLYRGLAINVIMQIPISVTFIPAFLFFREKLCSYSRLRPNGIVVGCLAGGIAGAVMWTSIVPLDVIRTRIVADSLGMRYNGTLDCIRKTYREDGFKTFFRGLSLTVVRGCLMNAVMLSVYMKVLIFSKGISNFDQIYTNHSNEHRS